MAPLDLRLRPGRVGTETIKSRALRGPSNNLKETFRNHKGTCSEI